MISEYDFKDDAEWLTTEGCPININDDAKHHGKIMERAGLKQSSKKGLFSSGRRKLVNTFRSLSGEPR